MLWQKKDIVAEAYSITNNIHTTSCKWYILPNQVHQWKANEDAEDTQLLPEYPAECTVEVRALKKNKKVYFTRHHGCTTSIATELLNQMTPYLGELILELGLICWRLLYFLEKQSKAYVS